MTGPDSSSRRAVVLRRLASILLGLVAILLALMGATALASPDYFDVAALGTVHFYGWLAISFASVAALAAVGARAGRSAFRNLGCAGTWLLAFVFGPNAFLIANLVPNSRVSVETTSAIAVWALAIGTTAAGVMLILASSLDSSNTTPSTTKASDSDA